MTVQIHRLAPEIAALLPAFAGRFPKPWTAEVVRADLSARAAARPRILPHVGDERGSVSGVPVTVYRAGEGRCPTILFVHGGGWVAGDVETHDDVARRIADAVGGIVVSVDYRRPPETPFPGAVQDCRRVLETVVEKVARFGGDPSRVAIAGDSAGANLAVAALLNARLAGPLAVQLLLYPALDLRGYYGRGAVNAAYPSRAANSGGPGLTIELLQWFSRAYCPSPALAAEPLASPILAGSLALLPPTIVALAECDPLRDEGATFADRLRDADIPTHVHPGTGLVHGYFGLADQSPTACAEIRAVLDGFARLLNGKESHDQR